ncbi:MAG: vitamin K epoxide reductase family protein [Candidatus Pacearchaeota archaeon]
MKKYIKQNKYEILLFLFAISLISSVILSINLMQPSSIICDVTEGCHIVANSEYSKTFGIENAFLGLFFFTGLMIITILQIRKPTKEGKFLINFGAIIGGIWAIYSLYLMEFVIKAYCKYCTALDASSILAVVIVLLTWKD